VTPHEIGNPTLSLGKERFQAFDPIQRLYEYFPPFFIIGK
jgi:hypothetical protein